VADGPVVCVTMSVSGCAALRCTVVSDCCACPSAGCCCWLRGRLIALRCAMGERCAVQTKGKTNKQTNRPQKANPQHATRRRHGGEGSSKATHRGRQADRHRLLGSGEQPWWPLIGRSREATHKMARNGSAPALPHCLVVCIIHCSIFFPFVLSLCALAGCCVAWAARRLRRWASMLSGSGRPDAIENKKKDARSEG
jgi:hypothetical protein